MSGRDPLLPRWVVIGIAILVSVVWGATAVVAFLNPEQSGALITVSSLMAMVLTATFGLGLGGGSSKKGHKDDSGSDS